MLPKPSPRATPPERHVRVNQANVIKWMQALPASRREPDLPGGPVPAAPCRKEPCTAPAPAHPLPDPALARLCAVPQSAPPFDDEAPGDTMLAAGRAGGAVTAATGPGARPPGPPRPGPEVESPPPPERAAGERTADQGPAGERPADQRATGERTASKRSAGERAARKRTAGKRAEGQEGRHREAEPDDEPGPAAREADRGLDGQRPTGARPPGARPPGARPPWPSQFAQVLAETLAGARSSAQLTPWTTERARGHIRRLGPLLSASQQPRIRRVVASTPASGIVELTVVVNFGPRVRALAVRLERTDPESARQSWLCTAIEAA